VAKGEAMFEFLKKRKRVQPSPSVAHPGADGASARERPAAAESSTDADDFHVPPSEVFQEEEQDGQGSSPRLHGE
jgi:hypothetical protein